MTRALVEVKGLRKSFAVRRGLLHAGAAELRAVDGVDLAILEGETLALVGESGSGKSTFGRCILRLLEASEGEVRFDGEDLLTMTPTRLRRERRHFQMVFQDPYGSLNPRLRVGRILAEPLSIHEVVPAASRAERVDELLELVRLPEETADRFPHELSGGQRQRIGIARALASEPRFIVADEPVAALDASVRAQILNVLAELKVRLRLTLLLIAHDLTLVEKIADRVATLYLGRLVELAPTPAIFSTPQHPYTVSLLDSMPVPEPSNERRKVVWPSDSPDPLSPPTGCAFHPRCPVATELCRMERPELLAVGTGHEVACHHPGELELGEISGA